VGHNGRHFRGGHTKFLVIRLIVAFHVCRPLIEFEYG
jgi:hypothetical protein